ncbi:MAG: hypothetical protein LUD72_00810, partial [Bacteroidales bacterium]|nr:hypothetical protein [Bacteroidales bacterium]
MKSWKTAATLAAVALIPAIGLTSCGDTETEWVTAPTISASQAVVTVPDEGGTVTVGLTITNPVDGATISASPSASWVTVESCSASSVGLSVDPNPNADPRTARVTVSYSYTLAGTKGTASCELTVAQSCGDQPAISVQPTAVAAAIEGGSYSFSYTIVNPAPDGEVSASASASWITDIDCSKEGEVGFSVGENTGGLRQATVTLSYSWSNGSLSESVTVVQDHHAGDDGGDVDIEGTYTMTGVCYESYPY